MLWQIADHGIREHDSGESVCRMEELIRLPVLSRVTIHLPEANGTAIDPALRASSIPPVVGLPREAFETCPEVLVIGELPSVEFLHAMGIWEILPNMKLRQAASARVQQSV